MNPSTILSQLQTQLQGSSDLSYVNDEHIFLGRRVNITNYPAIAIEPNGDRKVADNYPYERIIQSVLLIGMLQIYDSEKQIVGSGTIKGIADFKNDIKKAISSDHTLAGNCVDMNIISSTDDLGENYPVRGFNMVIEILYDQDRVTRA